VKEQVVESVNLIKTLYMCVCEIRWPIPLEYQYTIKNKTKKLPSGDGYQWEREGRRRTICLMYFVYVYENIIMKPVKIVLRTGI
jgi:hypothetical protein